MTMETDFRALLVAAAGVGLPAARINWGAHPQGVALPAVVLNVIDDVAGLILDASDGLSVGRVQVDCYGATYAEAKTLSASVRSALHAYSGGRFRLVSHVATRDSREGGTNDAERVFRAGLDFMTHWRDDT